MAPTNAPFTPPPSGMLFYLFSLPGIICPDLALLHDPSARTPVFTLVLPSRYFLERHLIQIPLGIIVNNINYQKYYKTQKSYYKKQAVYLGKTFKKPPYRHRPVMRQPHQSVLGKHHHLNVRSRLWQNKHSLSTITRRATLKK